MTDALTQALVNKLEPILYLIGLVVVLGILSFGGTLFSLWFKRKEKQDDAVLNGLSQNTIAIARMEAKLDMYIQKTEKDLINLGTKIKMLDV